MPVPDYELFPEAETEKKSSFFHIASSCGQKAQRGPRGRLSRVSVNRRQNKADRGERKKGTGFEPEWKIVLRTANQPKPKAAYGFFTIPSERHSSPARPPETGGEGENRNVTEAADGQNVPAKGNCKHDMFISGMGNNIRILLYTFVVLLGTTSCLVDIKIGNLFR